MTRKKAVKELIKFFRIYAPEPFPEFMHKSIEALKEEPRTNGHWEERIVEDDNPWFRRRFYCTACGDWITYGKTKFCPNCGAKMRREDESNN